MDWSKSCEDSEEIEKENEMKLVVETTSPDGEVKVEYVNINLNHKLLDQYSQEMIEAKIVQVLIRDTDVEWEITDVRLPRETLDMENKRRSIYNGCDPIGAI